MFCCKRISIKNNFINKFIPYVFVERKKAGASHLRIHFHNKHTNSTRIVFHLHTSVLRCDRKRFNSILRYKYLNQNWLGKYLASKIDFFLVPLLLPLNKFMNFRGWVCIHNSSMTNTLTLQISFLSKAKISESHTVSTRSEHNTFSGWRVEQQKNWGKICEHGVK